MAWTKCMEDNQDFFTDNMMRNSRSDRLNGVDITGLVYSSNLFQSRMPQYEFPQIKNEFARKN